MVTSSVFNSYSYPCGTIISSDINGNITGTSKQVLNISERGQKISQGHPGPPYRSGGTFLSKKVTASFQPSASVYVPNGSIFQHYSGVYVPNAGNVLSSNYIDTTNLASATWGATGFARAKPGNPTASMGQFLIELRDLPTIPFRRLSHFRDLGSEYLNIVFGWKPFVQDLQSMYATFMNLRAQLEKLVANRGKPIKRRLTLGLSESSTTSTQTSTFGGAFLFPGAATYSKPSSMVTNVTTRQDYRFSGTFKYWIPDIGENLWTNRATYALFGVSPTPKLLWDVIPWTWLIGWCSNIGDVLNNISSNAVDNLVADHAYITGKLTRSTERTVSGFVKDSSGSPLAINCSSTITDQILERVPASPYGFGVHSASLDAGQIAILGALGISRHF